MSENPEYCTVAAWFIELVPVHDAFQSNKQDIIYDKSVGETTCINSRPETLLFGTYPGLGMDPDMLSVMSVP